jgi:hypothetical protein
MPVLAFRHRADHHIKSGALRNGDQAARMYICGSMCLRDPGRKANNLHSGGESSTR